MYFGTNRDVHVRLFLANSPRYHRPEESVLPPHVKDPQNLKRTIVGFYHTDGIIHGCMDDLKTPGGGTLVFRGGGGAHTLVIKIYKYP